MSDQTPEPTSSSVSAEDMLPPVQPPTAGFIMQLFLIPLLIVMIIVSVWLLFSWLAHKGTSPTKLVAEIERLNHSSWQRALTLANQLQDSGNRALRNDAELAGRLAEVLKSELESGSNHDRRVMLRVYLCKALGEFEIDTGADALVEAATIERDVADLKVRRAALQAIGFLADRLGGEQFAAAHPQVMRAVFKASEDADEGGAIAQERARIRYNAAFTLGILGDAASIARLEEMLIDPSMDVRFNAAAGLARNGNAACAATLVRMLTVSDEDLLRGEKVDPQREESWVKWKRDVVAETAIQSILRLVELTPDTPQAPLAGALEAASKNEQLGKAVRIRAEEAIKKLSA